MLGGYDSSDDEINAVDHAADAFGIKRIDEPSSKRTRVDEVPQVPQAQAAPDVLAEDPLAQTSLVLRPTDVQMNVNVPYEDMIRPVQGPQNPFDNRKLPNQNALAGHVEEEIMTEHAFRQQHLTHEILGYSANPSTDPNAPQFVGNVENAEKNGFKTLDGVTTTRASRRELKRKRAGKGDLEVIEGDGEYIGPWAKWDGDDKGVAIPEGALAPEDIDEDDGYEDAETEAKKDKPRRTVVRKQETSTFHGKELVDYQGRTYMDPPIADAPHILGEAGNQDCFVPKECIHTWTGHTGAVSAIRLFPQTGHLLLSSSMDTKVKLWDVYKQGNCLRTFAGHTKAVKDVTFSNDGRRFLSCGFDRAMKLWDTETGQCIKVFSNGKIPHVIKFHPDEDKQHIFLAGMSDKKIIQYDINTAEIIQEYDQHLGPVNSITFVDENRRFVTTSDDKTIRAWDYDIPVVIKYIAEPHMHSMPSVALHPTKKWFAAQSLDNQILVYSTDNFRQNRKKRFAGHTVSGYACQVNFSPDGRLVSSGDGQGNMVFWDWKTGRIRSRINKAHEKVVIAHEWLPHETSKVVTASWDGLIKLWVGLTCAQLRSFRSRMGSPDVDGYRWTEDGGISASGASDESFIPTSTQTSLDLQNRFIPIVMSQHRASLLPQNHGEIKVGPRPTPVPQGKQALVKVTAAAINPVDWKIQGFDMLKSFPAVLGTDGAGIIEAVGPEVTNFKVGERVFFQGVYTNVDQATFQEKTIVEIDIISKTPDNITDDQASTIPVGTIAGVVGLFQKSGIDFPVNGPTANGKGVLVLGGSSSVGQFGIQLARIAGFSPIVTTASAQHAEFLKSLGATHVFDRDVDVKTIQSAFPTPVSLVLDSISAGPTQSLAFDVLTTPSPAPDAHLAVVLPPADSIKEKNADNKVSLNQIWGSSHMFRDLSVPFWQSVGQWIKDGKFVPNRVQVVGGLAAVPEALDLSRKGVSGVKLIIHPQE